jgi:modulator of FtsH protease HflK
MSGVYIVGPDEQAVVLRLGREVGKSGPGLHYRMPWPIQTVEKVNVQNIRRLEVGFRTSTGQTTRVPHEALMLTGDENIVEAQVIVQYRVLDPSKFLFRIRSPEETVRTTTEVALRSQVGSTTIDDVLTVGRAQVQDDTREFLQRLLDEYESGIAVTEVKLQVVDPPDQVKDAFHEVVRAREDRERLINQSQAYREDILPKARGEAQQIQRAAEAHREQRVIQAQGDVSRFKSVLEQYQLAPDVTRERIYLESIERILPALDKVILDEKAPGVLPLLGLRPGTDGLVDGVARGNTPRPAAPPAAPTAVAVAASQPAGAAARPAQPAQPTPATAARATATPVRR